MDKCDKAVILPIKKDPFLKGYLLYAFPLCILLAYPSGVKWAYQHYFDACSYINEDEDINLEFFDGISYGKFCKPYGILTMDFYEKTHNISEFVVESINKGEYVIVFNDEFYRRHNSDHFLHEIMIYGYDSLYFYYLAFDENDQFASMTLNKTTLVNAYLKGLEIPSTCAADWAYRRRIINCKYNDNLLHQSNTARLKLQNYFKGGIYLESATYSDFTEYRIYHGVNNTDLFLEVIRRRLDLYREHIPYPGFHFLLESKQLLMQRLELFGEKAAAEKYAKAIQHYGNARRIALKDTVKQQKNSYVKIYDELAKGKEIEEEVGIMLF